MGDDVTVRLLFSLFILLASAFFVGAEYALIGCRRSSMEALAKRGNKLAKRVVFALKNLNRHLAGTQACITMVGIGAGTVTEPFITSLLLRLFDAAPERSVTLGIVSLVIVTFFMVVVGELVPKYVVLNSTDKLALALVPALTIIIIPIYPLTWLMDITGAGILRLFGIRMGDARSEAVPRDEMLLLIKAQSAEGLMEDVHAKLLSRAFQLDKLDAHDIMVHRMDIRWLDLQTPREHLHEALGRIRNTRIPVCRGDIDDVAGVLYLHDFVRHWHDASFNLESILRPVVAVPENLTLEKVVERMRESHSQLLIVLDEYGGTAGLITLEDVVEEIFGELEDRIETERPMIEIHEGGRISARAEVRFDELVDALGVELSEPPTTDPLAQAFPESLGRVPRLGDTVETPLGTLRIENMARRRVTRVSLMLNADIRRQMEQPDTVE